MYRHDILEGIRAVVEQHLGMRAELREDTHLLADLELDSLQQLTLVVELENHFQVCFEDGDELGLATVRDVIHLIDRRLHNS